jgi:16S rRNA (adenine1518-N6/adenine1519-N6)-dimethyltransferase
MDTRPKRRFGQHFLTDRGVLTRLVRLIEPARSDLFLEIGAGSGPLSVKLAESGARLLAVELDRDLLPSLTAALSAYPEAFVIPGDVLSLDIERLVGEHLAGRTLRGAGNLPYNIATAVIEKLLYSTHPWRDMVFMVQLEVAERIVARPGTKQYGVLSIQCQSRATVKLAFEVKPGSFSPAPAVTSAVITLRPRSGARDPQGEARLLEVVRAAFSHRRKTLVNSLRRYSEIGSDAPQLLARAGLDGSLRGEQLSVGDYEKLARVWKSRGSE